MFRCFGRGSAVADAEHNNVVDALKAKHTAEVQELKSMYEEKISRCDCRFEYTVIKHNADILRHREVIADLRIERHNQTVDLKNANDEIRRLRDKESNQSGLLVQMNLNLLDFNDRIRRQTTDELNAKHQAEINSIKQDVERFRAARERMVENEMYLSTLCPITRELMNDPVMLDGSGHSFERAAIERYMKTTARPLCPTTGLPFHAVYPNHSLRILIEELAVMEDTRDELAAIDD